MPREEKSGVFGTNIKGSWVFGGLIIIIAIFAWSSYNGLVKAEETIDEVWANVQTEYQARADKVKNLVKTVEGAAKYENETLLKVVEERANMVKGININMDELTPEKMAEFEKMQSEFTGSLSKLLAVFENYPDLKAVKSYQDFQAQYEGIENRIAKARRDYNGAVKPYNAKLRRFPTNIFNSMYGFEKREYFKANEGTENAPDVDFNI